MAEKARGAITDVAGVLVGHWTDVDSATGCTVILCEEPFIASGEVRGGAPGTRETDLLVPGRSVEKVDAILLSGGSAFGLASADGVMRWLREKGRGFPTQIMPVPIVPGAVIYDLAIGTPSWPEAEAGYLAAGAASVVCERGSVGAGTGATVGKFLGMDRAVKSGIGSASLHARGGLIVAALAVVNALGNVLDPSSGCIVAGARNDGKGFVDASVLYSEREASPEPGNTTLVVVATNAALDRCGAYRLAQVAHDGLARSIVPVHTQFDGDTVFSLATGKVEADLNLCLAMVTEVVAATVIDAVLSAQSLAGLPALSDLPRAVAE